MAQAAELELYRNVESAVSLTLELCFARTRLIELYEFFRDDGRFLEFVEHFGGFPLEVPTIDQFGAQVRNTHIRAALLVDDRPEIRAFLAEKYNINLERVDLINRGDANG